VNSCRDRKIVGEQFDATRVLCTKFYCCKDSDRRKEHACSSILYCFPRAASTQFPFPLAITFLEATHPSHLDYTEAKEPLLAVLVNVIAGKKQASGNDPKCRVLQTRNSVGHIER
jgi:hypothetical protein